MAKLQTMMLVLMVMYASLMIYGGNTGQCLDGYFCSTDNQCCLIDDTTTCAGSCESPSLWKLFFNPTGVPLGDGEFILVFIGLAGALAVFAGIALTTIFGTRTDTQLFAPMVGGLIITGAVIFINLYNFLQREIINLFFISETSVCRIAETGTVSCPVVQIILAISLMPFLFIYIWSVLEWWRGKDM
jgi:hypothetical protein